MAEEQDERKPTERVILELVRVVRVPDGVSDEQLTEAVKALTKPRMRVAIEIAYVEVARHTAATKKAAIEVYAGKSGTADAKVGEWRAPPTSAWKGVLRHDRAPAPVVQGTMFDG